MQVVDNVKLNIIPIVEQMGYEVIEVEYAKKYGKDNLTLYIYKKGGISLDDCVAVNDALEQPLEDFDVTGGREYVLNISSPGLDREIKTDDDLRRNLDLELEATVKVFVNKKGKVIGKLVGYDEKTITLANKDKLIVVQRDNIRILKQHVKF